ncbi:ribosome maturation factor RimP [Luteimicrobium subarcticum]|uniref:Ribosome maturation factor RimP n=1 Tax=Luteimicrobium subarcticum TaxID=620910 RepID=A0A2M8WU32_9MICO|nr:ribosome maturation factor RimP [Luteimicrobium subarcticum]PJI94408.1 ribosome maturation factor RimP [Luteimicrobium subarcticum]
MARHNAADAVQEVVAPVVDASGLYLEDVTLGRSGPRTVVRITLDLPEDETGSLDLDRVAEVSRAVSDALDAADTVSGEYTLEVSTPGVSRPLTERRHFLRARGRLVRLALRDGGAAAGRLDTVDGDDVVLTEVTEGPERVALADVARGTVEVEMKRAESADLDDPEAADDAQDEHEGGEA